MSIRKEVGSMMMPSSALLFLSTFAQHDFVSKAQFVTPGAKPGRPSEERLVTGFHGSGNLYLAPGGDVMPVEFGETLFLVDGDVRSRIKGIADLEGKVLINSPSAALSFARLTTTPLLRWALPNPTIELLPLAGFNGDLYYAVCPKTDRWPSGMGDWGRVSEEWMAKHHISVASTTKSPQGWRVTRWVWPTWPSEESHIQLIEESITSIGGYTRRVVTTRAVSDFTDIRFSIFRPK